MSKLLLNSNYLYFLDKSHDVSHRIALCKSNFLMWYLIELSRNSGALETHRGFESSITFHHILSQPFPNNDKYGNFPKVLLFPSGSFHSMGMKQGLIVSQGNIPKLCLCIFVLCGYFMM